MPPTRPPIPIRGWETAVWESKSGWEMETTIISSYPPDSHPPPLAVGPPKPAGAFLPLARGHPWIGGRAGGPTLVRTHGRSCTFRQGE